MYIIFTVADVMESLGCAEQKANKLLNELDNVRGNETDAKATENICGSFEGDDVMDETDKKDSVPVADQMELLDSYRELIRDNIDYDIHKVLTKLFVLIYQIVNCLSSAATIYYCNWILGTYNDGKTQALYYVLGQFPLGLGVVITSPLSKKFGRKRLMQYGLALAMIGGIICLTNPRSLPAVLSGQLVRSVGLIPVTFMMSGFLGDALDDVKRKSDLRCDGFTSSVYNCIITMSGGIALFIFNMGIAHYGYLAPTSTYIPVQPEAVSSFTIFCVIGLLTITYPVLLALFSFFQTDQ